ncbi:MAG: MMPL family transporter [Candidatus Pacearchaeota archaeon]
MENNSGEKIIEENKEKSSEKKFDFELFYNKYYKIFLFIPLIILLICAIYLYDFNNKHGDLILKDITLSGGTSIQINTNIEIKKLKQELESNFDEVIIRQISDITTGEQVAVIITTKSPVNEIKPFLENYLGFELNSENSTIEFTGSALSGSFYNQLKFALIISFLLMATIVFVIFRNFIPSIAVVFAALGDIIMTLTVINILEIRLSTAGIIAFLMLIGYSVDSDILLTTRVIKRSGGTINSRIYSSFKTGITMTLTSLLVVIVGLVITSSFSKVFSQIFTILSIGLIIDIFNTWFFNAGIIKWYFERKK